ncbi:Uncharacterized protein Rs2_48903 [Raphanus sativus]|nr:Uncharacterized protein Rs2_48903 [Raphanus sativus]
MEPTGMCLRQKRNRENRTTAELPRKLSPQLQLEGRECEDLKKSFRSLLEHSIKWRIPSNHMTFMMKTRKNQTLRAEGQWDFNSSEALIAKGSQRVIELSRTEVCKLVAKSPADGNYPSGGWRAKEGGFRLASVLSELNALDVYSFAADHITEPLSLLLSHNEQPSILRAACLRFLYVAARHDRISSWSGNKWLFC